MSVGIYGVEVVVADKLEKITVKLIRACLGYHVYRARRMHSGLRLQSAGLDLEFLQRVGERRGHFKIIRGIAVRRSIQNEVHAYRGAARDRNALCIEWVR